MKDGGDSWYFITVDYAYNQQLAHDSASFVVEVGNKVLGEACPPFPGATDFFCLLLQVKTNGAKVAELANSAADANNCIKQAAEFGITASGMKVGVVVTQTSIRHWCLKIDVELARRLQYRRL